MDLREYLFRTKKKITDFAKEIGYGRGYITEIINGTKTPGKHLAKTIEHATNGEVTAEELMKGKNNE